MASLFEGAPPSTTVDASEPPKGAAAPSAQSSSRGDVNGLIAEAAQDLADYQRLTAEGKLGEAGQKLQQLKRTLDAMSARRK
jgi:hypothetical protein